MTKEQAKDALLKLYEIQIMDLTLMSKIELGDDVIAEIKRLKKVEDSSTETVTISKETLQRLLSNFYEACSLCDEMDVYEFEEGDSHMQDMKSWAEEKFGRKIKKGSYE